MLIDATAGAYGLFQVVFADLTEHLAVAVFRLRQVKAPGLTFEQIFRLEFKRILDQFKEELKQFDGKRLLEEDLHWLLAAVDQMAIIAKWRHERIHARVRPVDGGLGLYDWRTRERLPISYEECKGKIDEATKLIVTLEAHVPQLVGWLDWNKMFEREWDTLFEQKYDAVDRAE